MTEKKFKNPFVEAAKKAAASKMPEAKTNPVQQAKIRNQVSTNRPITRTAGRGR